jgi:hypothetical protein
VYSVYVRDCADRIIEAIESEKPREKRTGYALERVTWTAHIKTEMASLGVWM